MALVQFEPNHKRILARYKQKPNEKTSKCFLSMDAIAKQLAAKDLKSDDRDALANKLKDKFKKLKIVIKEDLQEREKEHAEKVKKPPEGFDVQAATRTWHNVKRELLALEKKAGEFAESGGVPPPPPKLPSLHFGADYKQAIVKCDGTLSPAVVAALAKLDATHEIDKAMELLPTACELLKKQLASVAAEIKKSQDAKEKARWTLICKELSEFEKKLDIFENHLFLLHRLKG